MCVCVFQLQWNVYSCAVHVHVAFASYICNIILNASLGGFSVGPGPHNFFKEVLHKINMFELGKPDPHFEILHKEIKGMM